MVRTLFFTSSSFFVSNETFTWVQFSSTFYTTGAEHRSTLSIRNMWCSRKRKMFHWSLPSKSRSFEPLKIVNHSQQNPSTVCGHKSTFSKTKKYCNICYDCLGSNVVCIKTYIFQLISRSRYLSTDQKEIVDPVIQRNSFFTHTENILIIMITDDREHGPKLGLRRILKARHTSQQDLPDNSDYQP